MRLSAVLTCEDAGRRGANQPRALVIKTIFENHVILYSAPSWAGVPKPSRANTNRWLVGRIVCNLTQRYDRTSNPRPRS